MNQLHDFFEHATSEVYVHLRNRRVMLNHKVELEKQQKQLAKRLRQFEKENETQLRVARSRLRATEAEFNDRTIKESKCWTAYQLAFSKTDSFAKCLGVTFSHLINKKPGIAVFVTRTKKLAADWEKSFKSLREAGTELEILKGKYRELSSDMESDRFAIRNLASQIQQTTTQLNSEEEQVNQLIKAAAKQMSYTSIARKQTQNSVLDQAFFDDVRVLRRLMHRIDSLQHIAKTEPAAGDALTLQEALEYAAINSFKEYKHPLKFDIHLRGKGRVRQVTKMDSSADLGQNAPVDTRVVLSETKSFSTYITLKHWDLVRLGNEVTDRPLLQLNRAMVESTHHESNDLISQLKSEADLGTQRIAKVLFTRINP